jgi:hypothetical protein
VAALDGALALAQVQRVAVAVGQQLDLDVARPLQELLHVHRAVAERGLRLVAGRLEGALDLVLARHDAHPLPAPARRGLRSTG